MDTVNRTVGLGARKLLAFLGIIEERLTLK